MRLIPLHKVDARYRQSVGGKAAVLGELLQNGFPVPEGFCITGDAFHEQVSAWGVELDSETTEQSSRELWLNKLRHCILHEPLLPELIDELRLHYGQLGEVSVAVRSSATEEDQHDASFAGQHDTFLHIHSVDELIHALRKCWLSFWGRPALHYREHMEKPVVQSVAVLVQKMVNADYSGVVFTEDPIGISKEIVRVEVAKGYGDALVSGILSGVVYEIDKLRKKVLRSSDARFLPKNVLRQMTEVTLAIEKHFSQPQDIEFAIQGEQLFVLQSRPITTITHVQLHSMYRSKRQTKLQKEFLALAEERYPHAPLPIDQLIFPLLIEAAIHAHQELGFTFSPEQIAELKAQMWRTAHIIPPPRPTLKVFSIAKTIKKNLYKDWNTEWMKRYSTAIDRIRSDSHSYKQFTTAQLHETIQHVLTMWERALKERFVAMSSFQASTWVKLILLLLFGRRSNTVFRQLMSGIRTYTSETNDALQQLAELAKQNSQITQAIETNQIETFTRFSEGRQFVQQVERFIDTYEHREGAAWYLSSPTWGNDPSQVWRMLQSFISANKRMDSSVILDPYTATLTLVDKRLRIVPFLKKTFHRLLTSLRELERFKENSHFVLTKYLHLLQQIILEMAKRLINKGAIHTTEELYYLSYEEVLQLLESENIDREGTSKTIATRKHIYKVVNHLWRSNRFRTIPKGRKLKGTGVSIGKASGKACVIHDESQFHKLKQGDILVCNYTNPSWTPLFTLAAGVVTEKGGASSHAAIVAREYQIPAVMGVEGICQRVQDGQELWIDGESGKVVLAK